jgi:hypothetical protein
MSGRIQGSFQDEKYVSFLKYLCHGDNHLYSITYTSTLKKGKSLNDFQKWLKSSWEIQQAWGAESVYFWSERNGKDRLLFCQYMVKDIRRWNRSAIRSEYDIPVTELAGITEMNRITIRRVFSFGGINPNN